MEKKKKITKRSKIKSFVKVYNYIASSQQETPDGQTRSSLSSGTDSF